MKRKGVVDFELLAHEIIHTYQFPRHLKTRVSYYINQIIFGAGDYFRKEYHTELKEA